MPSSQIRQAVMKVTAAGAKGAAVLSKLKEAMSAKILNKPIAKK